MPNMTHRWWQAAQNRYTGSDHQVLRFFCCAFILNRCYTEHPLRSLTNPMTFLLKKVNLLQEFCCLQCLLTAEIQFHNLNLGRKDFFLVCGQNGYIYAFRRFDSVSEIEGKNLVRTNNPLVESLLMRATRQCSLRKERIIPPVFAKISVI